MNANKLICSKPIADPFRLFFPAGMLLGIIGVALWPLFQAGQLSFYPATAHARLLIQGFAACFIFGFLMTAGPRLIGIPSFTLRFVVATFTLTMASSITHLFQFHTLGDSLFCLACLVIIKGVANGFAKRTDTPPPGFPLAALGLLSAMLGSGLLALSSSLWPNPYAFSAGKILLYQGFTLLPIIGVGGFFFPKILGGRNLHAFPEMLPSNKAWKTRFSRSILTALFFLLSVVFEIIGQIQLAYTIRIAALGIYLFLEVPFKDFTRKNSPHGIHLIIVLASIGIGLTGAILFPDQRVSWLHAYFLVGLTGVILLVSLRVVFGHSGRPDLIRKSVKVFAILIGILALAATSRIFADFAPSQQKSHYLYAALGWLACGIAWMVLVGPSNKPPKGKVGHNC